MKDYKYILVSCSFNKMRWTYVYEYNISAWYDTINDECIDWATISIRDNKLNGYNIYLYKTLPNLINYSHCKFKKVK